MSCVGLLIDRLDGHYQASLLSGVVREAQRRNLDLVCFVGGSLRTGDAPQDPRNLIYDLAKSRSDGGVLDGLLIAGGTLGNKLDPAPLASFYGTFFRSDTSRPIVSIGRVVAGYSSVVADNSTMGEAVTHLVNDRGHRTFAFIPGPEKSPEALERKAAFDRAIAELENSVKDIEVVETKNGAFERRLGREAIRDLQAHGIQFDAVVAANDEMALGAMDVLTERRRHGKGRIPAVAVVGFDNIDDARAANPPLATIDQALESQGRAAVRKLTRLMSNEGRGRSRASKIVVPTEFIPRESCGCDSIDDDVAAEALRALREKIQAEKRGRALSAISESLITASSKDEVRKAVLACGAWDADEASSGLLSLGIPFLSLSLYGGQPRTAEASQEAPAQGAIAPDSAELFMLHDCDNSDSSYPASDDDRGKFFASCELVPRGREPRRRPFALTVQPLFFREEALGFVVLGLSAGRSNA